MKIPNKNQSGRWKNRRSKSTNSSSRIAEHRKVSAEPIEDVNGCDSAEACPVIAKNLLRVSAHLQVLAHLIEVGNAEAHAPSIMEAQRRLKQCQKELPSVLRGQLELALDTLPLGLIQMGGGQS